jgi:glycosyltransferase involved in cell wall biosynthesis
MKPFISLCMIVKNEEKVLQRCLGSVKGIVDEIIIVDTGSNDRTKEISFEFVDHVYEFEWTDSFAEARNFAASKANGDWILVLDADEFVDRENLELIIQELKINENPIDAYAVKIYNFVGVYAEQIVQHSSLRIYKNDPDIKFYRSVHEQVGRSDGSLQTGIIGLILYHSGYLNNTVIEKKKTDRNTPLVKRELEISENKGFDYFNLGNEYFSQNNIELALDAYKNAYLNKPAFEYGWVGMTVVQIINCLNQLSRFDEALKVISDAENIWKSSPDFQCFKANVYIQQHRYDDAKEILVNLINNTDYYNHFITSIDFGLLNPHLWLGKINALNEDYEQSVYHFMNVLKINRMHIEAITNILTVLSKYGTNSDIFTIINKYNWLDDPLLKFHVIRVFLNLSNLDVSEYLIAKLEDNTLIKTGFKLKLQMINGKFESGLDLINKESVETLNVMIGQGCFDLYDLLITGISQEDNEFLNTVANLISGEERKFVDFLLDLSDYTPETNQYLTILERCIQLRQFDLFEQLLVKKKNFESTVNLQIGHLLYRYDFKELAIDFYNEIDVNYYDNEAFLNIIASFIQSDYLDDALEFVVIGLEKDFIDYRLFKHAIEILITKNKEENKDELIDFALKYYPDSNWLKDMAIFS